MVQAPDPKRTPPERVEQPKLDALPSTAAWTFKRASDVWDDTDIRITPSVGRIGNADDYHVYLFYLGALNNLFGGSGVAKSWIAVTIALQEIRQGRTVIFLDYESSDRSLTARLRSIGATKEECDRFIHVSCGGKFGNDERDALDEVIRLTGARLLFIDTAGASVGVDGGKNNDDHDLIRWRQNLPMRYVAQGLCVIEIDHTGVSAEAQTRVAGGHRKKGGLTGIQLQAEPYPGFPHAKGQLGKTKLICRKDREGTYPEGSLVAVFTHEDDLEGWNGRSGIWAPTEAEQAITTEREQKRGTPRYVAVAETIVKLGIEGDSIRSIVAALALQGTKVGKDTVAEAKEYLRQMREQGQT